MRERSQSPSHSRHETPEESMEVTHEQHLQRTMDDKSFGGRSSGANPKSSRGRKTVKSGFLASIVKPRLKRGTTTPTPAPAMQVQPQLRRSDSLHDRASSLSPVRRQRSVSAQPTPLRRHSFRHSQSNQLPRSRSRRQSQDEDNISIVSDNVTVEGLRSVATNQTISSIETVKASNKTALSLVKEEDEEEAKNDLVTPWKKLKRALKPFRQSSSPASKENIAEPGKAGRRRIQSFDHVVPQNFSRPNTPVLQSSVLERSKSSGIRSGSHPSVAKTAAELQVLDQSVRGRLDGLDVITLGSALRMSTPASPQAALEKCEFPWEDTRYSVTGQPSLYSPAELVNDMLWTSGGRTKPEIILEGYLPGPEDRWTVQIESPRNPNYTFTTAEFIGPPSLHSTSTDDNTASTVTDEQDSPLISSHKLWISLWGKDPVPSGQPNRELLTQVGNIVGDASASVPTDDSSASAVDDPVLTLAADSSIPIDVDEDTFIVSTREHLMAVQDIAAIPLSEGRFDTALRIFEKLALGLPPDASDERKYLRGATLHNIGLVHLWQGNFVQANAAFNEALAERRKHMTNHMDIVVTQSRQAQCLFALEQFDESVSALENCLQLTEEDAVIRAKVLNNLAIVHFHNNEVSRALRYLAQALEQQREWLDGPIRRESIVYEASVSLSNMGKLYLGRTDYALCSSVYEEALLLQTSIFQKEHPAVLQTYLNLAWSKALNGNSRAALRLLESCHRVQKLQHGADSSAAVETIGWMAHLYARAERYTDALPLYHRIRQWQKQYLKANTPLFSIAGPHTSTHPSVRLVRDCIKRIEGLVASKTSLSMWL